MHLFLRHDLTGIVATLKDLLKWHLREAGSEQPAEKEKAMKAHEEDFREAKPFLDPLFTILSIDNHWEDVLAHTPRRIEVALLPMTDEDRRRFPHASQNALTLFVSLPRGCVQRGARRPLWGYHMPNRFHFSEVEAGTEHFTYLGSQSPADTP